MSLCMDPPPKKNTKSMKPNWRSLCTHNTGAEMFLDVDQFEKVKNVHWYERRRDRVIMNKHGATILEYLGLKEEAVVNAKIYDFRLKK